MSIVTFYKVSVTRFLFVLIIMKYLKLSLCVVKQRAYRAPQRPPVHLPPIDTSAGLSQLKSDTSCQLQCVRLSFDNASLHYDFTCLKVQLV